MKHALILFLLVLSGIYACQQESSVQEDPLYNPAAPGFKVERSDSLAMHVADLVMQANGGRKTWDETRFLRWNFFGNRRWYWDKFTGDIRVEIPKDTTTILYNLESQQGRLWKDDQEWDDPDTLAKYFQLANNGWINDSYWLFMPFKLKDSGVTLHYVGTDTLPGGGDAHVLSLTFEEVGVTPDNKYHVWVDASDHLVKQWAFYANWEDEEPRFRIPWEGYQDYQGLLLAASRGPNYEISEIAVFPTLDTLLFQSLEPPIWQVVGE